MPAKVIARKMLSPNLYNKLSRLYSSFHYLKKIVPSLHGKFPRSCPICGFQGHFVAFGSPPRWDAGCPNCGSLERHRLLYLVFEHHHVLPDQCELLHFAPESVISAYLKSRAKKYVTADLEQPHVDLVLNIEQIALDDSAFDVVVCNHVLEHVNDAEALKELYRILRPGGVLFVMVPIVEGWADTYENRTIVTPSERELHFGQFDHVRLYGADFRTKLRTAGFDITEFTAFGEEAVRHGLLPGEKVFVGAKPVA